MAILKNGILSGPLGKVGPVVGYMRRGVYVIRSKAEVTPPRTEKQKATLQRMQVLSPFLNLISDYLAIGFQLEAEGKSRTPNNEAKSYNLKYGVKGQYPNQEIDYPGLKLTSGQLPIPEDFQLEFEDQGLKLTWNTEGDLRGTSPKDQLMLMAYFPESDKVVKITAGKQRKSGLQFKRINAQLRGKTMEVYVSFISENRRAISNSKYLGRYTF
ncbi:DUF6266 family protein [Pedobacter duraquae]|uniref:Uncharacterized protein n=1 Tax=Pedobacter duraquae TaxID=425511 RepID=A0A4R6ILQ5_9SPHI|nr:DUF6266 family protein [Pedobacter duraquae]TDO22896.1 hypothetical protein CLV32_1881 [Pedobacter duraquae]